VSFEITPEPSPEERAAIEAALERLSGPDVRTPAWWQAGVQESTDDLDAAP
jgi:hypothetical protein